MILYMPIFSCFIYNEIIVKKKETMRPFTVCFPVCDNKLLFRFSCNTSSKNCRFKNGKKIHFKISFNVGCNDSNIDYNHPLSTMFLFYQHIYKIKELKEISGEIIFNKLIKYIIQELQKSDKNIIIHYDTANYDRIRYIKMLWLLSIPYLITGNICTNNNWLKFRSPDISLFEQVTFNEEYVQKRSIKCLYNTTLSLNKNNIMYNVKINKLRYGNFCNFSITTNVPCMDNLIIQPDNLEDKSNQSFYIHPFFQRYYNDIITTDVTQDYYRREYIIHDNDIAKYLFYLLTLDDIQLRKETKFCEYTNDEFTHLLYSIDFILYRDLLTIVIGYVCDIDEISYIRNVLYLCLVELAD